MFDVNKRGQKSYLLFNYSTDISKEFMHIYIDIEYKYIEGKCKDRSTRIINFL